MSSSLSPSLSLVVQLYRQMFVSYQTRDKKRGSVKEYTRSSRDFLRSIDLGILPNELISEIAPVWKEGCILLELHDYRKYPNEDFRKYRNTNPEALHPVVRRISLRLIPAVLAKDIEAMVEKYHSESWTKDDCALEIENMLLLEMNPSESLCLDPSPRVMHERTLERLNTPHLQNKCGNHRYMYRLVDQALLQRQHSQQSRDGSSLGQGTSTGAMPGKHDHDRKHQQQQQQQQKQQQQQQQNYQQQQYANRSMSGQSSSSEMGGRWMRMGGGTSNAVESVKYGQSQHEGVSLMLKSFGRKRCLEQGWFSACSKAQRGFKEKAAKYYEPLRLNSEMLANTHPRCIGHPSMAPPSAVAPIAVLQKWHEKKAAADKEKHPWRSSLEQQFLEAESTIQQLAAFQRDASQPPPQLQLSSPLRRQLQSPLRKQAQVAVSPSRSPSRSQSQSQSNAELLRSLKKHQTKLLGQLDKVYQEEQVESAREQVAGAFKAADGGAQVQFHYADEESDEELEEIMKIKVGTTTAGTDSNSTGSGSSATAPT